LLPKSLITLVFCCLSLVFFGQNKAEKAVIIQEILLEGLEKTKEAIVWRELDLKVGDTLVLENLAQRLERNKSNLVNTNLFKSVIVDTIFVGHQSLNLKFTFDERWYFWPWFIFDVIDQNWNVWWKEKNRDLNRATYGFSLEQHNWRGRNETLTLDVQGGFLRNISLTYYRPAIGKKRKWGVISRVGYWTNRKVPYRSEQNKLVFYDQETPAFKQFAIGLTLNYRKNLYTEHFIKARYESSWASDTLLQYNPQYFFEGKSQQRFLSLGYIFERDLRDIKRYALKGYYIRASVVKKGFGIFDDLNTLSFETNYSHYFPIDKSRYVALNIKYHRTWGEQISYLSNIRIGTGDNDFRGYELYSIDTQEFLFLRADAKQRLFAFNIYHSLIKKERRSIANEIYLRLFTETGWVRDHFFTNGDQNSLQNNLNNGHLFGAGLALDFVVRKNSHLSVEYSYNKYDKKAFLFFHFGIGWDDWRKI